jgi:hypothetical protein
MSEITNLPVAPEFTTTLEEKAVATLIECLNKLDAPKAVIGLVNDIYSLGYYRAMCAENPEFLTGDCPSFDAAGAVVETVNHLAEVGAIFEGAYSESFPRKGTLLDKSQPINRQPTGNWVVPAPVAEFCENGA